MTESDRPMSMSRQPPAPEPLRATLSDADDRIRLNHWMLQQGIAPRIRSAGAGSTPCGPCRLARGVGLPDRPGANPARASDRASRSEAGAGMMIAKKTLPGAL